MEETKNTNAQAEDAGTRDEEATSSETLSDIEENEKVSGGGGSSDGGSSLEVLRPNPTPAARAAPTAARPAARCEHARG